MSDVSTSATPATVHSWGVFICYRQADGGRAAEFIHSILDGAPITLASSNESTTLDVYYDQTAPAVDDWHKVHRPALERARTLILVCSPGAATDFGKNDWVYKELKWWLANQKAAPILVQTTSDDRFIPATIRRRWPNAQRILLTAVELEDADLNHTDALRQRIRIRITEGLATADTLAAGSRLVHRRLLLVLAASFAVAILAAAIASGVATFERGWRRAVYLDPPPASSNEVPVPGGFDASGRLLATAAPTRITESVGDIEYVFDSIRIRNATTGEVLSTRRHPRYQHNHTAALSPRGDLVAAGGEDGVVWMYDARHDSFSEVNVLQARPSKLSSLRSESAGRCIVQRMGFSNGGDRLAWGDSCDRLYVWQFGLPAAPKMFELPRSARTFEEGVRQLVWSADDTAIGVMSQDLFPQRTFLIDLGTGRIRDYELKIASQGGWRLIGITATRDGLIGLVDTSGDGTPRHNPLRLYRFETAQPLDVIPTPDYTAPYDATFDLTATVIAATTSRNTVCVWEKRGQYRLVAELPESASKVQLSPRGNVLAARSGAGTAIYTRGIRIWGAFIPSSPNIGLQPTAVDVIINRGG